MRSRIWLKVVLAVLMVGGPTLLGTAPAGAAVPTIVVDKTAMPSSLPEPGGAFTFNVVVINTSLEPVTITTLTDNIYGNIATQGTCTTAVGTVLPASGGTYTCSFTGNFTGGGGASQIDVVTATAVDNNGAVATDTDSAVVTLTNVLPAIIVDKTATPLTRLAPGGAFTFIVVVTDTGIEPVTITTLTDNIYGNIATRPGTCSTAVGTVLAPGATYSCSFSGNFFGAAGASQTDIITATAVDNEGSVVTDTDDATVTITNVIPSILVDKTASPRSLPEPGGAFTFNVVATNTGIANVTITTLADDVYGNIATQGTCTTAIGTVLPANGGSYFCSFTGNFFGDAGASQADVVTVTAVDNNGSVVTDTDDAVVIVTDVPPTVLVDKTATPISRPEPGGTFTFTVVLTNTSFESVVITSLTDNIYGSIATQGTCTTAVGTVLPPNGSTYTCSFTGPFNGSAGASETDVVTAVVRDNDGTTATGSDDATVTLTPAPLVTLATTASAGVVVGGAIHDTATLTGGTNPTGTITFNLFGPDNATCSGTPIFSSIKTVTGAGAYDSASFVPTAAGTYRWVASYSGDANNNAVVPTACADPAESVTVTALPTIAIAKTATPASLPAPGGTFTFDVVVTNISNVALTISSLTDNIYGNVTTRPGSTCNTAIGTVLAPAPGPGNTYSCSFQGSFNGPGGASQTDVVTVRGFDSRGNVATAMDDATVTITPVTTAIRVVKGADPLTRPEPGGTFTFTVRTTNVGATNVTITSLTDNVYGDLNGMGTCAIGAVLPPGASYTCSFTGSFTGAAPAAQTDTVTVKAVDNQANEATSSGDATVTLMPAPPVVNLATTASAGVVVGGAIHDTATLTGGTNPTGTITFNLFGPDNATCAGTPIFSSIKTVTGAGAYDSASFVPTAAGTYRWVASYSGDANNNAVVPTACADPAESVTVTALPSIAITKTATPTSLPAPGGTFTFGVVVTNISNGALTITSLTDNIYGNVTTRPGSTCNTAIGTVLAPAPGPGNTYSCSFPGAFSGPGGASQTDVVTVTGADNMGNVVSTNDDATVTITPVTPAIRVVKGADPLTRPEPGGAFTFTVRTTNVGPTNVTITSLTDNVYGDLNGMGTCATGAALPPGASYTCAFTGVFTGVAPAAQTDTVTVKAVDNQANEATASDDATVTLTPAPPVVTLATTASAGVVVGGAIHDTASLTGGTAPTGTITFALFGPDDATCAGAPVFTAPPVPVVGASSYDSANFTPTAPGTYRWVATYSGDANNSSVTTACGDAAESVVVSAPPPTTSTTTTLPTTTTTSTTTTLPTTTTTSTTVAPPSPSIRVDGTAVVGNLPEPGGTFTGRAVVTNTSTEALTLTALADEDLNGVGTCSVPQPLAPGGTYSCTFPIVFTGKAGDTKTVPVTASAVDASGRQATAQDTFVITITSVVTPVVVFPPPAGLSFPLTPQVIGPLARTGTDLTDRILLALVLVLAGTLMLVATWRRAISPGQARRSKAFARRDDPGSWTG